MLDAEYALGVVEDNRDGAASAGGRRLLARELERNGVSYISAVPGQQSANYSLLGGFVDVGGSGSDKSPSVPDTEIQEVPQSCYLRCYKLYNSNMLDRKNLGLPSQAKKKRIVLVCQRMRSEKSVFPSLRHC